MYPCQDIDFSITGRTNLVKCCPTFQKMQNCIPTKDFTHLHCIKNKIFLIQNKLTANKSKKYILHMIRSLA